MWWREWQKRAYYLKWLIQKSIRVFLMADRQNKNCFSLKFLAICILNLTDKVTHNNRKTQRRQWTSTHASVWFHSLSTAECNWQKKTELSKTKYWPRLWTFIYENHMSEFLCYDYICSTHPASSTLLPTNSNLAICDPSFVHGFIVYWDHLINMIHFVPFRLNDCKI